MIGLHKHLISCALYGHTIPFSTTKGKPEPFIDYLWRSQTSGPGAQFDLIIDRADGFLNICEIRYSKGDYALTTSRLSLIAKSLVN